MDQLACTVCGREPAQAQWRCACGGPLDLPDVPASALRELPAPSARDRGLWRYHECIPVSGDIATRVSLGEGMTSLTDAGEQLPGVTIKLDYLFPTLSFKDRGAVVLVASALQRGAQALVADSSGNAGSAIAAYAARSGLRCTVFVPERTSTRKQNQIRAYGAALERVAGDRTATTEAAIAAVSATGAMYASHIYDPYFLQGTKTYAFELWEQIGTAPEALLMPVGNGTLLLGAARGFRELHAAGLIDRPPALIAVQSERCAPLARAWATGAAEPVDIRARDTVAEGIAIPRPPRGSQILAAVRASDGCVVEVPEEAVAPAQAELARRGLFVEPTAALTWAAALLTRSHPALADVAVTGDGWDRARELASARLVVPLCGSGLKSA
jgi:threonine synthase